MASVSLKAQLLVILNAAAAIAGTPVKAVLTFAIWAIGKYLPDTAEGTQLTFGAAPDNVKSTVRELFDRAVDMIPSAFARRMVQSAATLVLDYFIDTAWDALAKVVTFSATAPEAETEADKAAAAMLEAQ
jgi:hypothetical protein